MSTRRDFLALSAAVSIAAHTGDAASGPSHSNRSEQPLRSYRIPRTDLDVSRIAFGCDNLVEKGIGPDALRATDIARAATLIRVAHDNGITLFDLADVYGLGSSEAVFGHVLKQSPGLRRSLIIQTKCGGYGLSAAAITNAVEGSLKRLETDYLDILLLHIQDPLMDPEEVALLFDQLNHSGKVRNFGVSNHTISRIELLKKYVRQPLVISQVQFGLAHSDLLNEPEFLGGTFVAPCTTGIAGLDYCRLNEMQMEAYSPLKGKDIEGPVPLLSPPPNAPANLLESAKQLADIARQKETTPATLALAWILRHPGRILPIIGSKSPEHIIDACAADGIQLSREEWSTLFSAGKVLV